MMRTSTGGFTLVELLVVLLILSVVLIAVPIAYDRIKPRLEMRSEAREIAQILRDARGRAIRDNEETTVTIDVSERYLLSGDHGPRIVLSEGITLTLDTAASEQIGPDAGRIRFFPSGSSTGGQVILQRRDNVYRVEVDWLFGRVRVLE